MAHARAPAAFDAATRLLTQCPASSASLARSYTAHGGLKATYIAAWGHGEGRGRAGAPIHRSHPAPLLTPPPVAVIYIALVIFTFLVYATPTSNVGLGSIRKVYDNLARVAQ